MQNSNSRITIMTGLWGWQLRNYHSNPERGKSFFFLDQLCGPPSFLFSGCQWSYPLKKWKRREVGRSLPPCAQVQNVQSYTSTSLYTFMVYTNIMIPSSFDLLLSFVAVPFVVFYYIASYSSTVSLPVCIAASQPKAHCIVQ